ncbi:MAG: hypothetical protein PHU46_12755 [Rhodocyclaceae bacterium]|nr:hypothetical protein [Rhodocyclaceae bacterium]
MKVKKTTPSIIYLVIIGFIVLILGAYALQLGGQVTLRPGKVDISAPTGKDATMNAPANKVEQQAHSSGEGSRAVNSLGDITQGAAPAKRSTAQTIPAEISQEAKSDGKDSKAMNAAGDIIIK